MQQAQKGSRRLGVRGWKPGGAEGGSWLPEAFQSSKIDGLTDSWQEAAWGGQSCFSKYLTWVTDILWPWDGGWVSKDGMKKHEFGAPMPGQGMRNDISGVPVAGGQRSHTECQERRG